ncbi:MAG TPA: response regulator [Candidatus Competibacter sp.]|nr:response regulator [Candidatus Competibacter sp.]
MIDRPKVLCVDDEPNVLEGLKLHLRRHYEVQTAGGGQMALELLEREGPFAVVLSDMRMPGMNGAALLGQVRRRYPDTTRMLLTGQADLDSAIAVVNEGQLFRFLTKPCPPPVLLQAFEAGVAQHRLITAERVLLEQTLRGVIQTLTDVLALTHPIAFGRANRLKRHAVDLAKQIGVQQDLWQLEVAAMLSQLGCIVVPDGTLEKLYRGELPNEKERAMAERIPVVTGQLLGSIPRLEPVLAILENRDKPYRFNPAELDTVRVGGPILKLVADFDTLINQGNPAQLALDTLRGRRGWYDPALLDAFVAIRSTTGQRRVIKEVAVLALQVGMVFAEDVRTKTGALLVTRGHEVTPGLLERLCNLQDARALPPVKVVMVADAGDG